MSHSTKSVSLFLSGALLACAAPAMASEDQPYIGQGQVTAPPRGFVEMCTREKQFCSATDVGSVDRIETAGITGNADRSVPPPAALTPSASPLAAPSRLLVVAVTPVLPLEATPSAYAGEGPSPLGMRDPIRAAALDSTPDCDPATRASTIGKLVLAVMLHKEPVTPALFTQPAPAVAATIPSPALLGKEKTKLLSKINRFVNARVRQDTDRRAFGTEELWRRSGIGPAAVGDCEDIAIEKRAELIGEGFPPERLSFAVVYSMQAGLHTVLVARTDDGDYVLDSRSPYVRRWNETPYTWLSIQSRDDAMIWHSVNAA